MSIIKSIENVNGELIEIMIESNQTTISSDWQEEGVRTINHQRVIATIHDFVGDAMDLSRKCALQAVTALKKIDKSIAPNEFELQIGIKFEAEVGAVLTKMGSEALLQVTMKWIHDDK